MTEEIIDVVRIEFLKDFTVSGIKVVKGTIWDIDVNSMEWKSPFYQQWIHRLMDLKIVRNLSK